MEWLPLDQRTWGVWWQTWPGSSVWLVRDLSMSGMVQTLEQLCAVKRIKKRKKKKLCRLENRFVSRSVEEKSAPNPSSYSVRIPIKTNHPRPQQRNSVAERRCHLVILNPTGLVCNGCPKPSWIIMFHVAMGFFLGGIPHDIPIDPIEYPIPTV